MKYLKSKKSLYYAIVSLFFIFFINNFAHASIIGEIPCIKDGSGSCQLNDIIRVVVSAATFLLGIVGSLALIMFVYGGFMFLISAGNTERITQARQILINAVLGIVIVFTSYMIIQFALTAIGYVNEQGEVQNKDIRSGKWNVTP